MAKTRRVKKRTHLPQPEAQGKQRPPKTFVFWRGKHGLILKSLESDLRKVMSPNTASHLKESKKNMLKDFVNIAGPLGVTHFVILTATQGSCYMRVAKSPRGPTVTLKIHEYALIRDVVSAQQRPRTPDSIWKNSPLVVMSSMGGSEELKLVTVLFQNLFPTINVQGVKLSDCQRVVLLSHNPETGRISFRHYSIVAKPSGVSKGVKSIVGRRLPDLSRLHDVSELLTTGGYGSESEGEEAAESRVTLPQDLGHGNLAARQSRVRLHEIGPRMELEVVKIEEGLCSGKVLHHAFVEKSAEAVNKQQTEVEQQRKLKEERRRHQEENMKRKEAEQRAREQASGPNRRKRGQQWWEQELANSKGGAEVLEQLQGDPEAERNEQDMANGQAPSVHIPEAPSLIYCVQKVDTSLWINPKGRCWAALQRLSGVASIF
ncbi:hypothetical protein WJX74_004263 [Apatococcus lobatus]|uniref:Brix domain-containing protein n=1 Tax=Apatococcus lobatus TaxID=904363 RepID=A0AAW1RPC3_9CHLO